MNEQIEMNFDISKAYTKPKFDGSDFDAKCDQERLTGQLKRIYDVMSDGEYRTLDQIHALTGDPHASISAQLRNLKKVRFGSHGLEKKSVGNRANGLWEYKLVVKK